MFKRILVLPLWAAFYGIWVVVLVIEKLKGKHE
jgi:hypothetical protein